ncbi:MAG: hypothetical protein OXF54_04495 [Caldilineaceae bacterium]|nr:hypothetical protein [Caldilineaceae bacterium]
MDDLIFLASPLCALASTRSPTNGIHKTVERGTARIHHPLCPRAYRDLVVLISQFSQQRRTLSLQDCFRVVAAHQCSGVWEALRRFRELMQSFWQGDREATLTSRFHRKTCDPDSFRSTEFETVEVFRRKTEQRRSEVWILDAIVSTLIVVAFLVAFLWKRRENRTDHPSAQDPPGAQPPTEDSTIEGITGQICSKSGLYRSAEDPNQYVILHEGETFPPSVAEDGVFTRATWEFDTSE